MSGDHMRPCVADWGWKAMCVLPHGLGGLVDLKSEGTWAPGASGKAFWALGVGGEQSTGG
jgi:hypothetical protein